MWVDWGTVWIAWGGWMNWRTQELETIFEIDNPCLHKHENKFYLDELGAFIYLPKDVHRDSVFYRRPVHVFELKLWKLHILIHIHKGVR